MLYGASLLGIGENQGHPHRFETVHTFLWNYNQGISISDSKDPTRCLIILIEMHWLQNAILWFIYQKNCTFFEQYPHTLNDTISTTTPAIQYGM